MPNSPIEHHITIDKENGNAVDLLAEHTGLSKQTIKQAMQKGAVWLTQNTHTQRLRRAKKTLQIGNTLHLYYDEQVLSEEPSTPQLIADEQAYSIWYKPYGMRSQGSKWGDHCTLHRWVEQHLSPQRPAFIVHRLDRAATGLMLIAHQKRMATALAKQFETRVIEKHYRVIIHGHFPITPSPYTIESDIDDRHAKSHVTVLKYHAESDRSLLDVHIETGRKHQIRRHLSSIGFPVVGDRLYGQTSETENLQLTAYSLSFQCPITQQSQQFQLPENLFPLP